ncbi:MAG: NAD(P)H-dependent oxidoreductase [Prevotella sp.]|nr:NAD(P)H-dependent oxidoreductase [Prevotella sp.]
MKFGNTIRKAAMLIAAALFVQLGANCKSANEKQTTTTNKEEKMEKILFVNGSPNRDGNTAALAKVLLEGRQYETLNLNDYRLNFYGQTLEGDQLDKVIEKMKEADIVVMGSPVYWHNICASVRTLMERFYGYLPENTFSGKRFFFLYQGAAPTKMMIDDGEYSMSRFARMYGFTYEGMATSKSEAKELRSKLK